MPVDFFSAHHTQSNKEEFGLYDDPTPAKNPSYIMEADKNKWIGIVDNPHQLTAHFYGLDHSLVISLPAPNDAYIESLCDGMLQVNNELIFVELKERVSSGWVGKATDQLINAIRLFAENHNVDNYDSIRGQICNSLKPRVNTNIVQSLQKFRTETKKVNFKNGISMELTAAQIIEI
ncbi:hypothetical protein [Pedobacter sp. GR22-10]|uniref:hypothetical protein n=1 Tax=Pedobacter sp. GR22-10 TaxID=2994472 RepID=UPI002247B1B0|nr:hypothetical protein [Pedobacter sp. GR22-10]MCX2430891.1 hypothetical protein [Pedobacter sp. GR22-10]